MGGPLLIPPLFPLALPTYGCAVGQRFPLSLSFFPPSLTFFPFDSHNLGTQLYDWPHIVISFYCKVVAVYTIVQWLLKVLPLRDN